ncbi:heme/hemin ABC transporter substrate-binding protein [Hoeflea poritis]|uniref:ABC transporter substrate-binding protein n=1 Tax=Hoeflea poritis TaxID=2993659 RepID=A0ABT4VMW1_9HYPH|nr:ABC transporter substrate-binding protein [Hoeflea poritis]MDA4846043.1 ABC transporter substrate-binding protein [Hoeflea poritis]
MLKTTRRFALGAIAALAILATPGAHAELKANKIVAIGGSVTEIVYALGEEERLVARDTTSTFPQEAAKLPDVGYIRALSPEGVLSIDPDLILALEGSGPPEAFEVLKKASVPVVTIPADFDRDGIVKKIKAIGSALGVDDKAAALAESVNADIMAAEKQAMGRSDPKRVLFLLSLSGGKIMAAGSDTSAASIIEMAGGKNALSDIAGFKQITDESAMDAAPDVILVMTRTGDHGISAEDIKNHPALSATPAAQNDRIVRMGGLYLLGFGPRTAHAIRDLSDAINDESR